jgi:hypothetical protein
MYRHVVQNSSHRRHQIRVLWDVVALVFDFPVAVCGNPIGETGRQRIAPLAMASICGRISQSWNDGRRLVPTTRSISLGHTLNFRELDHGRGECDKACVIPAQQQPSDVVRIGTHADTSIALRHFRVDFLNQVLGKSSRGYFNAVITLAAQPIDTAEPMKAPPSSCRLYPPEISAWDSQRCIRTPFS